MKKEEEKSIKEKLKEEYSFKEYHLEKFNINMDKYIQKGEIFKEKTYYLFNDKMKYIRCI